MFFCNPFQGENDENAPINFPFLIDYEKLPWFRGTSNDTPALKSSNSYATNSTFDGEDDDFLMDSSNRTVFHDASSDIDYDSTIFRSNRRRRILRFETVFWSCCLLVASLGIWMTFGDSFNTVSISTSFPYSFEGVTIWAQSAAVRIWETMPTFAVVKEQTTRFLELLNKIDNAILSLFRWDEVDDAIVDWTKRMVVLLLKGVLDVARGTVTLIACSSKRAAFAENVARSILQTIVNSPGAQQALALLDFIQDTEL